MNIGCVVMASGLASRFGSNKLLAPFLGEPLILHTIRRLPDELARVAVVTRDFDVAELCREIGIMCVLHELPDQSDTIRLGVREMDGMDGCFFCVADQPLLTRETMRRMMDEFEDSSHIVRAGFQGRVGNPVLFPAALFSELGMLQPGETGRVVIRAHKDDVRCVEAGSEYELMDIDTQDELLQLEKAYRNTLVK